MGRLVSLDWQRGLLALSIMFYHLAGWKIAAPQSQDVLGRLGIYAVSMFFLLSGLSMAIVYHDFIHEPRASVRFFIRRVFRIWPLLWVAVALVSFGGALLKNQPLDWALILLNLTTLFGFVSPGAYINTGAWSIGNEMVYYALTPALLTVYARSRLYGNLVVAATVVIAAVFATAVLSPDASLASQWQAYIHPLNNLCFYTTGVALYYNARDWTPDGARAGALLLIATVVFCAYPASGDLVVIVTGASRFVFFAASAAAVLAFYKLSPRLPSALAGPLTALGAATYGVYLLHPIVFGAVEMAAKRLSLSMPPSATIAATVTLTIAAALLSYAKLELPLIRLGKAVTTPGRRVFSAFVGGDAAGHPESSDASAKRP